MQSRLFYAAILAGLMATGIFGSKEQRRYICLAAIAVVILMYWLDVHFVDMIERSPEIDKRTSNSMEFLLRVQPEDSLRYVFDSKRADHILDSLKRGALSHKIARAFHPVAEQDIYYLCPLVTFLYFFSRTGGRLDMFRKRRAPR